MINAVPDNGGGGMAIKLISEPNALRLAAGERGAVLARYACGVAPVKNTPMPVQILQPDATALSSCLAHLQGGGLVAMPTETVYGLAADAGDLRWDGRVGTWGLRGRQRRFAL